MISESRTEYIASPEEQTATIPHLRILKWVAKRITITEKSVKIVITPTVSAAAVIAVVMVTILTTVNVHAIAHLKVIRSLILIQYMIQS